MKQIRNTDDLESVLSSEEPLWQMRVFDRTGVAVLPKKEGQPYWRLISSCGTADLDDDAEVHWVNGQDVSPSCEILNVDQLISYIHEMDTYDSILKDVDLGGFKKSELFWTIYYRILYMNRYPTDDPYMAGIPVFGMKQIIGGHSQNISQSELWFRASAVGVDELGSITVSLSENMSLNDIVDYLASQLRLFWDDLDMGDQEFRYDRNASVIIPKTYDDVVNSRKIIFF